MKKQLAVGVLLAIFSTFAMAHSGHGLTNAVAGFMHPFTGLDHLLMILAVGVWSARSSGKASVELSVTFILMLAFGASLGFFGLSIAGLETAIAVSVIAMGLLITLKIPSSTIFRLSIVSVFAILHGVAHGVELSSQHYAAVLLGMLLATTIISAVGYWIGSYRHQLIYWLNKLLALSMIAVGSLLLMY